MPENKSDKNCNLRKKRPERKLYVPPAQRYLLQKGISETLSCCENTRHETIKENILMDSRYKNTSGASAGHEEINELDNNSLVDEYNTKKDILKTANDLLYQSPFPISDFWDYLLGTYYIHFRFKYHLSKNLNCEFQHDCEFQTYLTFKKYNLGILKSFIFKIPIFSYKPEKFIDNLYILDGLSLLWQPNTNILYNNSNCANLGLHANNNGRTYPLYNFNAITFHDEVWRFNEKRGICPINMETSYLEILSHYSECENNVYKMFCDQHQSAISENDIIVDLSVINYGHFFIVTNENGTISFYECKEEHDVLECYLDIKRNKSEAKKSSVNRECIKEPENLRTNILHLPNEIFTRSDALLDNRSSKYLKKDLSPLQKYDNNDNLSKKNLNVTLNSEDDQKFFMDPKESCIHEQEKQIMRRAQENINRKTRPIMKYLDDNNDNLNIFKNSNTYGWEDHFDAEEKISRTIRKDVTILNGKKNVSHHSTKYAKEWEHMVELYDFPSTLETHDIIQIFSHINSDAMYVKWVDDTHAILVLGSLTQANRAVEMDNQLIRVRPMTAASAVTLATAYKHDLKPAMKRPQTNLQTARRLISSHLGTRNTISREQTLKEREDLKAAREIKKLANKNKQDAWEGNLRSN